MRGFKPFSQKTYGIAIFPLKYIRGFTLLTKISTHLQSNEHPTFSPSFASTFSTPPLFRHFQSLSPPTTPQATPSLPTVSGRNLLFFLLPLSHKGFFYHHHNPFAAAATIHSHLNTIKSSFKQ